MIVAKELASFGGVVHGFMTREGGYSRGLYASLNCGLGSGDDKETVRRNRAKAADQIGAARDRLITLYQHHSADVVIVDSPWADAERPKADAMVTSKQGLAIGVLTADCGPVLLCDPVGGIIGAAHAGWKGALHGILENTVTAMEKIGGNRDHIVAAIGPTISQRNYEVGPEFLRQFATVEADAEKWFIPSAKPSHFRFDLPGYIGSRLGRAGVRTIVALPHCTYAEEERYFSYRRTTHRGESDYGRQLSVIMLTGRR
jgi:hypothetical protein